MVVDTTLCPTPCPSHNPFSLQPVAAVGVGHAVRTPTNVATKYYEVATVTKLDSHGEVISTSTTVTTHDQVGEPPCNDTNEVDMVSAAPSAAHTGTPVVPPPIQPPPRVKSFKCEPRISLDAQLTENRALIILNHSDWSMRMAYMANIGAYPADVGYLWETTGSDEVVPRAQMQTVGRRTAARERRRSPRNPSLRGTRTFADHGDEG